MSEWQTEKLTKAYLQGVRGAIPGASLQFAILGKIAELWCRDSLKILDLGCGDGILGRFLLEKFPSAHVTFVDFSEPMLDVAHEYLGETSRATVVKADFSNTKWRDSFLSVQSFQMVVSGFAIHHQPDNRKKSLYAEIYDLLSPSGIFLNLEHVASVTPAGEKLFDEFFIDQLYDYHMTPDSQKSRQDLADSYYNRPDKKENILAPVEKQCKWLRKIGFQDVDCFFKTFELALFGGRKAALLKR